MEPRLAERRVLKIKASAIIVKLLAVLGLGLLISTGCESTEEGNSQVSGNVYYGVGFYDPWYYGGAYYPPDIIVTPPPGRPVDPPHVQPPIATPPLGSVSAPRPMPSIPSAPRPAFHR